MSILEKIELDYIVALKNKEAEKVSVLRMLKAELHNAKIEKKADLEESEEILVLNKEVKKRQDSVEQYQKGNRPELADKELNEITIIKNYLPKQISEVELEQIVEKAITETNAKEIKDMGKVMPIVIAQVKGAADNSKIAQVVKQKLA